MATRTSNRSSKSKRSPKNVKYGTFYIAMSQSVGKGDNGHSQGTGAFKLAWRAPIDAYPKEIAAQLGITAVDEAKPEPGLVFGANSPRPARVRINVQKSQGKSSSYTLFANPQKIPALINGNVLKGKTFKGGTITTVSLIGTSTNPNRRKKSTTKTSSSRRKTTTRKRTTTRK